MSDQVLTKNDSGVRYCHLLNKSKSAQSSIEWIQQYESQLKEMYNIWRTTTHNQSTFTDFCLHMEKYR